MSNEDVKLPRWLHGPPGFVPKANNIIDHTERALRRLPAGPVQQFPQPRGGGVGIAAVVYSVRSNYLICKRWTRVDTSGGSGSPTYEYQSTGDTFNVAKPFELQTDVFESATFIDPLTSDELTFSGGEQTRTATKDEDDQDQRIIPMYCTQENTSVLVTQSMSRSLIICLPMTYVVKDDDGETDVTCSYIEVSARHWTRTGGA